MREPEARRGTGPMACPALEICSQVGTARPSCRYDTEGLPPVGMFTPDPEAEWCPPGIATIILLLADALPPRR